MRHVPAVWKGRGGIANPARRIRALRSPAKLNIRGNHLEGSMDAVMQAVDWVRMVQQQIVSVEVE